MKAVNPLQKRKYVPLCDRKEKPENQTIATFNDLDLQEEALIENASGRINQSQEFITNPGTKNLLALHLGLGNLDNFKDKNGKAIVLKRDESMHDLVPGKKPWEEHQLLQISKDVRKEFAAEIMGNAELSEEEEKN